MANKIILKKSSVASKIPAVGDLDYGELALNYTDGILYYKDSGDSIQQLNPDTNTTYNAGVGLTLNGNTFDANVDSNVQTVASNAVSASAGRTYAIQVDASDNLVVNVPWQADTNTDTLQSIANDTADADRYITFVNSANGGQTGGSNASLRYNPSTGLLKVSSINVETSVVFNAVVELDTAVHAATTTTAEVIATFASGSYSSGRFVIQAKDSNGNVQISEVLIAHDGTTSQLTEFGIVHTSADPIASYTTDINTGNVRILATSVTANTDYTVSETLIV